MTIRLFEIRRNELTQFFPAFAVLLLTIAGHTLLETARDALFLTKLTPGRLAYVYVAVALSSVFVAPLSAQLSRVAGSKHALTLSLLTTALGAAGFWLQPVGARSVFALYVFGTLSATLLIGQFWMFAGKLFAGGRSRRLFGPLASGGVLGAVLGAGIASLLVSRLPVRSLLGAATLCYVGAALLAASLKSPALAPFAKASRGARSTGLARLRRDPFVLRLAVGAALSAFVAVIIDYAYKAKISSSIPPAQLGAFFARYQLALNLVSLVMQVGVTSALVERLGVVSLALLPPSLLALTSVAAAVFSRSFWPIVLLKATDSALRNSLTRVGAELLWAPVEDQARARNLVDVIVPRAAQAAAGLALLGLALKSSGAPRALAAVACGLAVLWFLNGIGLRAPYIELFRQAIGRGGLTRDFERPELDLTAVEALVEALAQPLPKAVLAAMSLLQERGRGRLIPALILYHRDEDVLLRALEIFGASGRADWIPLGEELLDHASGRVRVAAVRALALTSKVPALERASRHADPVLRAFGTLYLAQQRGQALAGDPLHWQLFENDDKQHRLKVAFIEALGTHPTPDACALLLRFARLPDLRDAVTRALVTTADEIAIGFLFERLAFIDSRAAARQSLLRIGDPALAALLDAARDPTLQRSLSVHVPRTLANFESERALRALLQILRSSKDGLLRYKALRGIEQIALRTNLAIDDAAINGEIARNSREYLRLFVLKAAIESDSAAGQAQAVRLLIELLDDKLRQSLDRLARLMQISNRADDMRLVFATLRAPDAAQRSRALEFLDASIRKFGPTTDDLAVLFRLVVDDMSNAQRVQRAATRVGSFADARSALTHLIEQPPSTLRELALQARAQLTEPAAPRLGEGVLA